jgi:hypothetical protein
MDILNCGRNILYFVRPQGTALRAAQFWFSAGIITLRFIMMIRHIFITLWYCAISSSFQLCPLRLELKSSERRLSFRHNTYDKEGSRDDVGEAIDDRDKTHDEFGTVTQSSKPALQPFSLDGECKIPVLQIFQTPIR